MSDIYSADEYKVARLEEIAPGMIKPAVDTDGDKIEDSSIFGLQPLEDGFSSNVSSRLNDISDQTSLILGINAAKRVVLGDSISVAILDGPNVDISVSTGGEPKTKAHNARISFAGIAKSIEVKPFLLNRSELGYVDPNEVYLYKLNKLQLDYGNINSNNSKRLLGVEFLDPGPGPDVIDLSESPGALDLKQCGFSNFRLVTKDAITDEDLNKICVLDRIGSANQYETDGGDGTCAEYLQDENNLFPGCNEIGITATLKNDPGIKQGMGANIVQYQRGLGKVSYEEMNGISKSITYATDQYSGTYCKGAKFTLIFAPFSMETIHTINTTNSYVRILNTSSTFFALDMSCASQLVKLTTALCGLDASFITAFGLRVRVGPKVNVDDLKLKNRILQLEKIAASVALTDVDVTDRRFAAGVSAINLCEEQISLNNKKLEIGSGPIEIKTKGFTIFS